MARKNAERCEERFHLPKDLYMLLTNLARHRLRSPSLIGAFMAGVAVGWHECGERDAAKRGS